MIVDDQPANVLLLERLVRSMGVSDVHTLTDPRGATALCLEVGADLVLLDLHMPFMDGFAVMEQLQDALPPDTFLPVLVLTADGGPEARDRALNAGAKDFLTKPFDRTEVLLRVRNLLETRALYAQVQRRNAELQADLDRRVAEERARGQLRQQRVDRIEAVLAGTAMTMVFQPVVELATARVTGVEALARFGAEPRRPPNEWFDEAATVGRGLDLELAAVHAALAQLHLLPPGCFLSVNAAPETAADPGLRALLEGYAPHRIVLELTEHRRVDDYETLLAALEPLRDAGVRVAVDDAGAGYSGLCHVLRLRPDILKLDLNLTRAVDADPARRAVATAMVAFGAEIGAVVIAEGIETEEELATLRDLGIVWGQGNHLGRPGSAPRRVTRTRPHPRGGLTLTPREVLPSLACTRSARWRGWRA